MTADDNGKLNLEIVVSLTIGSHKSFDFIKTLKQNVCRLMEISNHSPKNTLNGIH